MPLIGLLIAVALTLCGRVWAQEARGGGNAATAQSSSSLQLVLDRGGHPPSVSSAKFSPDGRYLVTSGLDKVARVWDLASGRTIRFLRGHIELGGEGHIYSLAISPDQKMIAVGGRFSSPSGAPTMAIRIHNFDTGAIAAILDGAQDVVWALAFSPDARFLVSGDQAGHITIWDVAARKRVRELVGHTSIVRQLVFSADGGRLASSGHDKTARVWDFATGKQLSKTQQHSGWIDSIGFWPDGSRFVTGGDDRIKVFDARSARLLREVGSETDPTRPVALSSDGKWLAAGCSHCVRGDISPAAGPQVVWSTTTWEKTATVKKHNGPLESIQFSPDGELVATVGGVLDTVVIWKRASGETLHRLESSGSSLTGLGFSSDGREIAWAPLYEYTGSDFERPFLFKMKLPIAATGLGVPEAVRPGDTFARSRRSAGSWSLSTDKAYTLFIKNGVSTVASVTRDRATGWNHRDYGFSADGRMVISGGRSGVLSALDLAGRDLGRYVGHEGDVFGLAVSADGRLLASASSDQTVRLWNTATRELLVTLFHARNGEWVMWTPQGYYTGSPGADKIVGWQINRGRDRDPDYVGADQLREHLHRPDIVARAISLASAEQAVREVERTTFKLADLEARPLPRFRLSTSERTSGPGRASIQIHIESTPDPIKAIRVQVNGRQVEERTPAIGSGGFASGATVLDVPLARGSNDVRITLVNAVGEASQTIVLGSQSESPLDRRGDLFIVAIGVDKYPGLGKTCGPNRTDSCDLRYSGADALAFAAAIEKSLGKSHARVVKRVLVNSADANDAPTASNILDALDLLKRSTENDTVVMFIAGHGINDGPHYRFIATDAVRSDTGLRSSTVVPWHALQEAVEGAKGRRMMFVDTCHAGNAYNQRLGNAAYHSNIVAYTAARFDQEALESPDLGHGLFTYAVVEALSDKVDAARGTELTTSGLASFLTKRVMELARSLSGEQEPQHFKARDAGDWVISGG